MRLLSALLLAALPLPLAAQARAVAPRGAAPQHDLVIANGRAIDPETGLDGVRWIGIRNGTIAAVSRTPLRGRDTLDARGHVVAPGFIDLHAHGQQLPAARMQAFDGVTTALELEAGTLPVGQAYERAAKEGRPINYGFSAAWVFGRIAEKEQMEPDGALSYFQDAQRRTGWQYTIAGPDEVARIVARVEQGLKEGAIGIGVLSGYAPGAGHKEHYAVAKLAKAHGVPTFTHVRHLSVIEPKSSFEAFEELIALAASTGAHMHISHLNSNSTRDIPAIAELIRGAQQRGLTITTEAYPAVSPPFTVPFHSTLPVLLSSATIVASEPPGVTISRLPSTSGDSAKFHPPDEPLKSSLKFLRHTSFPVLALAATRSPNWPRPNTSAPSVAGVQRGPW